MKLIDWLKSLFRRRPGCPAIDDDPYQQAVVEEVWRTGGPVSARVLDDGRLEIRSKEGTKIIDPRKE